MSGVCCSCQSILRFRLRTKLQALESLRRGYHHTPAVEQDAQPHEQTKRNTRSLYSDTIPPTLKQASAASLFFKQNQPRIAWVANEWRKQSHSPSNSHDHPSESTFHLLTPEIAFLGRSNTGKSSLLNGLLESPGLCRVGSKPGKTTTMHAWTLSTSTGTPTTNPSTKSSSSSGPSPHDRVTVLDMPGYGHGSHDEWGADIVKYLKRRRQLRRAMVLLNPKHGVKDVDRQILELLRTNNVPYQVVACKCDTLPTSELPLRLTQLQADVNQIEHVRIPGQGATLCISDLLAVGKLGDGKMNKTFNPKAAFGLDEVRWAILQATGLDEVALQQWMKAQEKHQRQVPLYRRGQKSLEQVDATPQLKVMDTTLAG